MNESPASQARTTGVADGARPGFSRCGVCLLLLSAAGISISLVWDFSWESTVGVDLVWSLPHAANYFSVLLAGVTALGLVIATTRTPTARAGAVRLGRLHAPLAAWIVLWGALAFAVAVLFDRWWQSAYGLAAGIWHPPQIFKAVAFFAVVVGVWLFCLHRQQRVVGENRFGGAAAFAIAGGLLLALITVVTVTSIYPNRQHSAAFFKIACGTYPLVLVALATSGESRWPATTAAAIYTLILGAMVWVLPLIPAQPQVAPIYNPLDHLLPPPFPLLLIVPALGLDVLLRKLSWPAQRARLWRQAGAAGLAFFILFFATQWCFAEFLLSDLADNWFFAGGGQHWPFFLKISPAARVAFWKTPGDELDLANGLMAAGLALLAAGAGGWLGAWMKRVRR